MKNLLPYFFIIVTGSALFFATLRGVWGDARPNTPNITKATMPMESSHERAPLASMLSLIENKRFDISKEYANFASPDVGVSHGKFFSYFPPAVSIWIIPFYLAGQYFNLAQVFAYYSMAVFSVLTMISIYLISKNMFKISSNLSILNALVFGFASTFWSYSTTIYQHGMATFLLVFSFYAAWKYSLNKRLSWIWAGLVWLSFGISIFVDYPNVILLAPVIVYFLAKSLWIEKSAEKYQIKLRTPIITTAVVFLALILLHGYYNNVNFGNWKTMSNVLPRYDLNNLKNSNLSVGDVVKNNKKKEFKIFAYDRLKNGVYELTIASDKGILYFSPIFTISILGAIFAFRKKRLEITIMVSIFIVNLLLYASFADPWGGWAFGPRYLIPSMAILSIFVGIAINSAEKLKWILKILTFILFGVSCAVALLGVLTTNLVPPKVEAIRLGMKYGYLLNIDYLHGNKTGSFLYNNYFYKHISLIQYFGIIFTAIMIFVFLLLFILPVFSKSTSISGKES